MKSRQVATSHSIQSRSINRLPTAMDAALTPHVPLVAALVALVYYFSAQFGFAFRFPGSPLSVIWPPNAILLAIFLLIPTRMWWPVLLAVLPAHILVEFQNGVEIWTILGLYVTNCGQAVLGAACVRYVTGGEPPRLDNLRYILVYGLFAVFIAPFILSFLDTAISVLTQWEMRQKFQLHFAARFISNALAALTISPIILVAVTRWRPWPWRISRRRLLEASALALGVAACGAIVFSTNIIATTGQSALLYLPLPFLIWAAVRFGIGGTSAALFGIMLFSAGWNTEAVHGPFVGPTQDASVLTLQLFLIALSAPVLLLAVLMEEQKRTATDLRMSQGQYRDLVETQTELICRYLPDGTLTFVNEAYCRYFGKAREELLGKRFFDLLPLAGARRSHEALDRLVRNPTVTHDEHVVTMPNGTIGWQLWDEHPIFGDDGALLEIQAVGHDITERKRAEQEIAWLAAHLLRAQDDERRRIARELHDGIAQTLAAIELILARLQKGLALESQDKNKVDQLLAEGHSLAAEAVQGIRTLSYLLHPPELEHLGLVGAIQAYAEGFSRRSGITVSVAASDDFERLPPDIEIALFRVVQECLTNVLRHSGSSTAQIRLFRKLGLAALQVRDHGKGMDINTARQSDVHPELLGVGIPGMRQRLLEFGGRIKITTGTGGTTVTVIIPTRTM